MIAPGRSSFDVDPANDSADEERLRRNFKLMRRLATTVALVTSGRKENWVGMAATAVVSVCAGPPTLLVAVNRGASIHPTLHGEKRFCVNLLSDRHRDLVDAFSAAKKGLARFECGKWSAGIEGVPVLTDALASVTCRVESAIDVGTHTLFIGYVENVLNHSEMTHLCG
jgi:flavin reductase